MMEIKIIKCQYKPVVAKQNVFLILCNDNVIFDKDKGVTFWLLKSSDLWNSPSDRQKKDRDSKQVAFNTKKKMVNLIAEPIIQPNELLK